MPFLFLSPSTQYFNTYVTTGNESYWMNRLADEMTPWLEASGVNVTRNDPNGSAAASIAASNQGSYDFHLALHSNAAPASLAGQLRGVDVYYYPTSELGLRMASILADNIRTVYPDPALVRALPSTAIGELRRTRAPSVLAELGYHDNQADADWLTGNLGALAAALARGVTEYFGLPFLAPGAVRQGRVVLSSGSLNLREYPEPDAPVLAKIPNASPVEILGEYDGWYTTRYSGLIGFTSSRYIETA